MALYKTHCGQQSFASLEMRVRHKLANGGKFFFNFSPLFDESEKIEGVVLSDAT